MTRALVILLLLAYLAGCVAAEPAPDPDTDGVRPPATPTEIPPLPVPPGVDPATPRNLAALVAALRVTPEEIAVAPNKRGWQMRDARQQLVLDVTYTDGRLEVATLRGRDNARDLVTFAAWGVREAGAIPDTRLSDWVEMTLEGKLTGQWIAGDATLVLGWQRDGQELVARIQRTPVEPEPMRPLGWTSESFAILVQRLGFSPRRVHRDGVRRRFDDDRLIMAFAPRKDRLHVLSIRVHNDARRLRAGCAAGIAFLAAPESMPRCLDWLRGGFDTGREQRRCFSHGILRHWVASGHDGADHGDWTGFELELVTDE